MDNHSSRMDVTIHLKRPTQTPYGPHVMGLYLVLLQVGFSLPQLLPVARCALTAPFHPYPPSLSENGRYIFCGTFRRLTPPRDYLALCPMEPGLSSRSFPIQRLPSQLLRMRLVYFFPFGNRQDKSKPQHALKL